MGRLAIVIPSVGSVEALESTLLSVLENRPKHADVLVVHSHTYDDPYQLQGEVRLIQAPPRTRWVACANLGFRETSADVVHLLAAGTQVQEGWTEGVLRHFDDPRVAVVAPMLLDAEEPTRALDAQIAYRAGGIRTTGPKFVADVCDAGVVPIFAASLWAAFYNRVTLSTVGYLSPDVGADLADVDLGLLLKHAGFRSILDPRARVRVPARPLEEVSAFARGRHAECLFWRNAPVVGWWKSLLAHPFTIAAEAASAPAHLLPMLCGRLSGLAKLPSVRRHHQRLKDLRDTAPVPATNRHLRLDRAHRTTTSPRDETTRAA